MCTVNSEHLNPVWQVLHSNGVSFVWIRRCIVISQVARQFKTYRTLITFERRFSCICSNMFVQIAQTGKTTTLECFLICSVDWPSNRNSFWHWSHFRDLLKLSPLHWSFSTSELSVVVNFVCLFLKWAFAINLLYYNTPISINIVLCEGVNAHIYKFNCMYALCSESESLHGIFNKENTRTMVCIYETASCVQLERSAQIMSILT